MKRFISFAAVIMLLLSLNACTPAHQATVVATTLPVYTFTMTLCQETNITVSPLITDNVSCLHDYTLQVRQMRMLESAQAAICSGAGLEDFMQDLLQGREHLIDASHGIDLMHSHHAHDHSESAEHTHTADPHIWLSPLNAKIMASNIASGLCEEFPQHKETINHNLGGLLVELDKLYNYGASQLSDLSSRELITFHDGFSYFAQCFDLTIAHAIEEESGSEASAAQLIELISIIRQENLKAIFTETNGSTAAAQIVSSETGVPVYTLDMAMSGDNYFNAMYKNIDTIKEALG